MHVPLFAIAVDAELFCESGKALSLNERNGINTFAYNVSHRVDANGIFRIGYWFYVASLRRCVMNGLSRRSLYPWLGGRLFAATGYSDSALLSRSILFTTQYIPPSLSPGLKQPLQEMHRARPSSPFSQRSGRLGSRMNGLAMAT